MPAVVLDQAVFTSAATAAQVGYQLTSRSEGVDADEARELAAAGPAHDALHTAAADVASINCWRLSSGRFALSKTTGEFDEYSQRGGRRVYTQFLLLDSEALRRFDNQPFHVLSAAIATGSVQAHLAPPAQLPRVRLYPRGGGPLALQLDDLRSDPGAWALAAAAEAVAVEKCVALAWRPDVARLLSAIIELTPHDLRPELSFTTGLAYSPRRPVRLFVLPTDSAARRHAVRQSQARVFEWETASGPASVRTDGGRLIGERLAAADWDRLAAWLHEPAAVAQAQN